MRILLTGATGFVGKKLFLSLFKKDHELVILSRNRFRAIETLELPCQVYEGDLIHNLIPPASLQDIDAVIHLAGESVAEGRWSSKKKKAILESRTLATTHLLKAFEKVKGKKPHTFISASAIGFYGDRGDELLAETSSPGSGFLSEVCQKAEETFFQSPSYLSLHPPSQKIRHIAFRIGVVLGKEGGMIKKLFPIFKNRLGGTIGEGTQWLSWIHVDDLVSMIGFVLENSDQEDSQQPLPEEQSSSLLDEKQIINAVAPTPVIQSEFARTFGEALSRSAFFKTPAALLKLRFGEMATMITSSQKVSCQKIESLGFHFKFPTLKAALADVCETIYDEEISYFEWIEQPVETVFSFFSRNENLAVLYPDWMRFQTIKQSTPVVGEGTEFQYQFEFHGIPIQWTSRIVGWVPNEKFSHVQIHGPFSRWKHSFTFRKVRNGTLLQDQIFYRLQGGFLGEQLVGPHGHESVRKLLAYRRQKVKDTF